MSTVKTRIGRALPAAALIGSLFIVVTGTQPPASAVAPTCTNSFTHTSSSGYNVPAGTYMIHPSYGTPPSESPCRLEIGDRGTAVRVLQRNLNSCYNAGLVLDGEFGRATHNALVAAQTKAGVSPDGVFGNLTKYNVLWARYSIETGSRVSCAKHPY